MASKRKKKVAAPAAPTSLKIEISPNLGLFLLVSMRSTNQSVTTMINSGQGNVHELALVMQFTAQIVEILTAAGVKEPAPSCPA